MNDIKKRCFGTGDPLYEEYHDNEWGIPVHNDRKLFEFLILDLFQAGLSWRTILHKRENFRNSFDNFDVQKISQYTNKDIERLLSDKGIVRNKMKIEATINNAKSFLKIQEEFGSFDQYIWNFTNYKTLCNPEGITLETMPAKTPLSEKISKDLKKRGFKFVGAIICYSFMQAIGMVDDHIIGCWKYNRKKSILF